MANDIRGEEIFDSRDVDARIEELEADLGVARVKEIDEEIADLDAAEDAEEIAELQTERADYVKEQENDADGVEELAQLIAFKDAAEGYCDWSGGEAFIRKDHFTQYAEQFAEDIGAVNSDARWPNNHIDWDAAAKDLLTDYTEEDLDGTTYYFRAS